MTLKRFNVTFCEQVHENGRQFSDETTIFVKASNNIEAVQEASRYVAEGSQLLNVHDDGVITNREGTMLTTTIMCEECQAPGVEASVGLCATCLERPYHLKDGTPEACTEMPWSPAPGVLRCKRCGWEWTK